MFTIIFLLAASFNFAVASPSLLQEEGRQAKSTLYSSATKSGPSAGNSAVPPPPHGNSVHNLKAWLHWISEFSFERDSHFCVFSTIFGSTVSADENVIYFATWAGEIKSYSVETNKTRTIVKRSKEEFDGIAWDPKGQHLYFSTQGRDPSKIFRANADGTEVLTVFSGHHCE